MPNVTVPPAGTVLSNRLKLPGGAFVGGKPADGSGPFPPGKSSDYVARETAIKNLAIAGGVTADSNVLATERMAATQTNQLPIVGNVVAKKVPIGASSIESVIRVGDKVAVECEVSGYPAVTLAYQWRNGTTNIPGAINRMFTVLTEANDLNCLVTPSNGFGSPVAVASNNLRSVAT